MKKIIMYYCAVLLLAITSCTKDKMTDKQANNKIESNNQKISKINFENTGSFKINEATLKNQEKIFLNNFLSSNQNYTNTSRRPICSFLNSAQSFLQEVERPCGGGGQTVVRFRTNVIVYNHANPVIYVLKTNYGPLEIIGTHTLLSSEPTCTPEDQQTLSDICPTLDRFLVTFTMNTSAYDDAGCLEIITEASNSLPDCPPIVKSNEVCFWACGNPTQCQNTYTNSYPNVIIFSQFTGTFTFATPCVGPNVVLCYPPYLICPNSITFQYRAINAVNWINGSGGFVSNLTSGQYEYRNVVFHYTTPFMGSSLPSGTGTFTVN